MQSDFGTQWKRRFEAYGDSGTGDAEIAGWSENGLATRLANFKSSWRGDKAGAVWLDIGCGAGTYTDYLAASGVISFGLDYSFPSLRTAQGRYERPCAWLVADALQLPIAGGSVDGVVCFGVSQAVGDIEGLIRELVAITRPGGRIWLDALNAKFLPSVMNSLVSRLSRKPARLRVDSVAEVRRILDSHGAKLVNVHRLVILPARLKFLQDVLNRLLRSAGWLAPLLSFVCHAFVIEAQVGGAE